MLGFLLRIPGSSKQHQKPIVSNRTKRLTHWEELARRDAPWPNRHPHAGAISLGSARRAGEKTIHWPRHRLSVEVKHEMPGAPSVATAECPVTNPAGAQCRPNHAAELAIAAFAAISPASRAAMPVARVPSAAVVPIAIAAVPNTRRSPTTPCVR